LYAWLDNKILLKTTIPCRARSHRLQGGADDVLIVEEHADVRARWMGVVGAVCVVEAPRVQSAHLNPGITIQSTEIHIPCTEDWTRVFHAWDAHHTPHHGVAADVELRQVAIVAPDRHRLFDISLVQVCRLKCTVSPYKHSVCTVHLCTACSISRSFRYAASNVQYHHTNTVYVLYICAPPVCS
jgi:hypothetical protein